MKRWWGIRHVRWFILRIRMERHYYHWHRMGYLPIHRDSDEETLNEIWRGKA